MEGTGPLGKAQENSSETPHRHFEKGGKSPEKEELFNLVITFTLLHPHV